MIVMSCGRNQHRRILTRLTISLSLLPVETRKLALEARGFGRRFLSLVAVVAGGELVLVLAGARPLEGRRAGGVGAQRTGARDRVLALVGGGRAGRGESCVDRMMSVG